MADLVNSPAHYQGRGGLEAITAIEATFDLAGHGPTVMKYILRHRRKGRPAEDLAKARWYVDRLICARGRLARLPAMRLDAMAHIADVFDLDGPARDALMFLFDAVSAHAEDRYRADLRNASQALGRAIERLERAEAVG